MCSTCLDGAQTAIRSFASSFSDMKVDVEKMAAQAVYTISTGVSDLQKAVNQIALTVFKAINDIFKNVDPTKSALQLVMAGVDLCSMAGVPVAACKTMTSSLKTVTNFVSAKSIFQKFDTFAATRSPFVVGGVDPARLTKLVGTGAFAVSDSLTFAKWCADNNLIGGKWYNHSVSVLGNNLSITPAQIQTSATIVGFSSNITNICREAWAHGGFTPETTLDLASNVGKLTSVVSSQIKTQAGTAASALASVVANTASIALFLMRRPPVGGPGGPGGAALALGAHPAAGDGPNDGTSGGVVNASCIDAVSQVSARASIIS